MLLSVRIEKTKRLKSQAGHDFDDRPGYANLERKHLNHTVLGGTQKETIALIDAQATSIKARYNEEAKQKRDAVSSATEKRKITSWRKTTATHKTMVISFCSEFRARQNEINKSNLDKCAEDFLNDFCKKNGCNATYLVRHDDETSTHYHATFTNINEETLKPLRFQMKDLSQLQDDAGACFSSMGIKRGIKRNERLDIARTNNPQHKDENDEDYRKRIYKLANVVHKDVQKLHEDLPKEIAEKQSVIDELKTENNQLNSQINEQEKFFKGRKIELEKELEFIDSKLQKSLKNVSRAKDLIGQLGAEESLARDKAEKNLRTYERRSINLNSKLEAKKEELRELEKSPIKMRIGKEYDIVIKKGFFKNETKKMNLVTMKEYEKNAHNLKIKSDKINKKIERVNKKENSINERELSLDKRESSIDNEVSKRLSQRVTDEALRIAGAVKKQAKTILRSVFIETATYEEQIKLSDKQIDKFEKDIEGKVDNYFDDDNSLGM